MASISGQSTANINQVDGFFTTQGGGVSENPVINSAGVQVSGAGALPYNTAITLGFNRSPVVPYNFVSMAASGQYYQIMAVRDDGTLWAYILTSVWIQQMNLPIGQWTQYGTDTDWEQVDSCQNGWGFIKGGAYWYAGYGSFGLRGDGSTTTIGSPTLMNNSFTWTKLAMGAQHLALLNSAGEVYTTGTNSGFATGLGVTTGTTTTLTREQTNLTGVTDISSAYSQTKIVAGGNIYSTGNNQYFCAGPLISLSAVDGPVLGYNGGDIDKIFCARDHAVATTTSGGVRHAGEGFARRLDNISTDLTGLTGQPNEQFTLLTAAGTGWTYYEAANTTSSTFVCQLAIKNGEVYGSFDNNANVWGNTAGFVYQRIGTFSTATVVMVDLNSFASTNMAISIT